MIDINKPVFWIAIAHLPRWTTERINRLIIKILHEEKITLEEFFEMDKKQWKKIFPFSGKEINDLELNKKELPRLAFIAEQLQNEGFHIIPINSTDYPPVLKENLKVKKSPPVLYVKGKRGLLHREAVAIVGSRNAGKKALEFTEKIAKKAVNENKIVASGFAKGIDRKALESAVKFDGKSIIVLPQGILTFGSGFKKFYEQIVNGKVLVVSSFFPKAAWNVGFAMARNAYIYGLAGEIYVAESGDKGGTWEGVKDGLKRGRRIFVREPSPTEKNANSKLIKLGAVPVDFSGNPIAIERKQEESLFETKPSEHLVSESKPNYDSKEESNVERKIIKVLQKEGTFSSKELIDKLGLNWSGKKMTEYLKKRSDVKIIKGKPLKFEFDKTCRDSLF